MGQLGYDDADGGFGYFCDAGDVLMADFIRCEDCFKDCSNIVLLNLLSKCVWHLLFFCEM